MLSKMMATEDRQSLFGANDVLHHGENSATTVSVLCLTSFAKITLASFIIRFVIRPFK